MEDIIVLVAIGMAGVFGLMGMKMFKPSEHRKQAKREVQDTAQKEVISSKDITITTLKNELRSLNGKLTRFRDAEPELEEDITENGGKQATFEEIQALVKTKYPKQAILLPLIKKQIMEATKGMTIEQILDYVKQFTGNKESTPEDPYSVSQGYNPNYA